MLYCPSVRQVASTIRSPQAQLPRLRIGSNFNVHFKLIVPCSNISDRDFTRAANRPIHHVWTVPPVPCETGDDAHGRNLFANLLADPSNDKLRELLYDWCVSFLGKIPNEQEFSSWLHQMATAARHLPAVAGSQDKHSNTASAANSKDIGSAKSTSSESSDTESGSNRYEQKVPFLQSPVSLCVERIELIAFCLWCSSAKRQQCL
jgi:hypothetical protein